MGTEGCRKEASSLYIFRGEAHASSSIGPGSGMTAAITVVVFACFFAVGTIDAFAETAQTRLDSFLRLTCAGFGSVARSSAGRSTAFASPRGHSVCRGIRI